MKMQLPLLIFEIINSFNLQTITAICNQAERLPEPAGPPDPALQAARSLAAFYALVL